jgi:hypothetical protein
MHAGTKFEMWQGTGSGILGLVVLELFQDIFAKFLLLFVALPHLVCPIPPAIL